MLINHTYPYMGIVVSACCNRSCKHTSAAYE
jgi:hypothetical protein